MKTQYLQTEITPEVFEVIETLATRKKISAECLAMIKSILIVDKVAFNPNRGRPKGSKNRRKK